MNRNTQAAKASQNNVAFAREFPFAKPRDLAKMKGHTDVLTRYLADCHDLTEPEVHDQLEQFELRQHLARAATDVRFMNVRETGSK